MHNQDIAQYISHPDNHQILTTQTAVGQTTHLTSQQPLNLTALETGD